jgi:glycosyltransferase involved in cell wall biosynthesis
LVSVVVPVYNVARYLEQCLDSILAQTLTNFELICVDDGSTDDCPTILKAYACRDRRVRLITNSNHGYGYSMNCGLDQAKGDWLAVVESDDWIEPTGLASLVEAAQTHDAEVAKANFYLDWTRPTPRRELFEYFDEDEDGRVIEPASWRGGEILRRKPSIWSAIYSLALIRRHRLRFLETPGASFQDTAFTFQVFALTKRLVCLGQAFLHYRQDNEASSINSKGKALAVCDEYEAIEAFVRRLSADNVEQTGGTGPATTDSPGISETAVLSSSVVTPDQASATAPSRPLRSPLMDVMIQALYDTLIWNYERLDQSLKFPFLKLAAAWLRRLLTERGNLDGLFASETWKPAAYASICADPLGYHTWREDERAARDGVAATLRGVPADFIPHPRSADPQFSIVVPVYNVAPYLRGCLESLVNQSLADIEVICVDDGSTDQGPAILAEYLRRDGRIQVITQANHGLATARNRGIAAAHGRYVLFVDSDDWLAETACAKLATALADRPAEVVVFGSSPYPGSPAVPAWLDDVLPVTDHWRRRLSLDDVLTDKTLQTFSWRHAFERDFLNRHRLRFPGDLRFGEDLAFGLLAFPQVRHGALFIADQLYHYRHWRPASLMAKAQANRHSFAQSQLHLIETAASLIAGQGRHPDGLWLGYLLDQAYGALTHCPEPNRTMAVNRFLMIVRRYGLSGCADHLTESQRAFWQDLQHQRHGAHLLNQLKGRLTRRLRQVAPPSRAQLSRLAGDLNWQINRQSGSIECQTQQLDRSAAALERQTAALERIAAALEGLEAPVKDVDATGSKIAAPV